LQNHNIILFITLSFLCSFISAKEFYTSKQIDSAVFSEMEFADEIGWLNSQKLYTKSVSKLLIKYKDTKNDDVAKIYIATELLELYLYKLKDFQQAKIYLNLYKKQRKKFSENNKSNYINLPEYTKKYKSAYFQSYYQVTRNITLTQLENKIVRSQYSLDQLMGEPSGESNTQSLAKQQAKLKTTIKKFESYLNQELTSLQRSKVLIRLSLYNYRLNNNTAGLSYLVKFNRYIGKDSFNTSEFNLVLKPISQVEVAFSTGKALYKKNDFKKAKNAFSSAIEIYEVFRSSISSEASRISIFTNMDVLYSWLIDTYYKSNNLPEMLSAIERTKARTLVERLNATAYLPHSRKLQVNSMRDLTAKVVEGDGGSLRSIRGLARKAVDRHYDVETVASTPYYQLDSSDLFRGLPNSAAMLVYYVGTDYLLTTLVSKQGIKVQRSDITNKSLASFINQLYESSDGGIHFENNENTLKGLYNILISGLSSELRSFKQLIVVPHGPLHSLPFDALISDKGYLVKDFNISYTPSMTIFQAFRKREFSNTSNKLLAYGNPKYPIPAINLPGAAKEVKLITESLGTGQYLIGTDASESHFRKMAPKSSIVHLSTHGKFMADDPMSSLFLLSEGQGQDGIVTAEEIFDINLSNTKLFVISACETSMEQIKSGDDMFGFTRSLSFSGVGSIISPLWSIDDKVTTEFMDHFYRNLATGKNISTALHNAKKIIFNKYNNPHYWAAFRLIGNPQLKINAI